MVVNTKVGLPRFSSVQLLSRVRLFATPWIAAHQASLSITNSQSLLKLTSIESVMPSSHLILCRPLSSCLESEQTLGDSERQGSWACCSPWGHKESDTAEWLNKRSIYMCVCVYIHINKHIYTDTYPQSWMNYTHVATAIIWKCLQNVNILKTLPSSHPSVSLGVYNAQIFRRWSLPINCCAKCTKFTSL